MSKSKSITYWIFITIITLAIGAHGGFLLFSNAMVMESFINWGYPVWFMYFIGLAEIAGVIGLHVKRTFKPAAICLSIVMAGAVGTHLLNGEWFMAPPSLILLALLISVIYIKKPS